MNDHGPDIHYRQANSYLPIRTVVKFYTNHKERNANELMTKTLLKAGFIDNEWLDKKPDIRPQDGEFWLVDVVRETCPGKPKGCFILHPIRSLDPASLNRLLPGMYTEETVSGCLVVEPKTGGLNWLLPLNHKRAMKDIHAILVKQ